MKKLLCFLGLHSFRKFYTGHRFDDVVYLECRYCKKRSHENTRNWYPKWRPVPLDEKWLQGKTLDPVFPTIPRPKPKQTK